MSALRLEPRLAITLEFVFYTSCGIVLKYATAEARTICKIIMQRAQVRMQNGKCLPFRWLDDKEKWLKKKKSTEKEETVTNFRWDETFKNNRWIMPPDCDHCQPVQLGRNSKQQLEWKEELEKGILTFIPCVPFEFRNTWTYHLFKNVTINKIQI